MRYFLDTEFIENGPGRPIYLISLGLVAEDGRQLYAIDADCPLDQANDWVRANILPNLDLRGDDADYRRQRDEIRELVHSFCHSSPEFWGYYADYDWVVFCQLFGNMTDLPKGWPMYCRDLKQWCVDLGNPRLPEQDSTEHNSLNDAIWNARVWKFLDRLAGPRATADPR